MRRRGFRLENIIASRYRRAGYRVRKHVFTSRGEIDILAVLSRKRVAVEAKSGRQVVTSRVVRSIYRKAKLVRARPKLKIGPGVKVTRPARELARSLGVTIGVVRGKTRREKRRRWDR